MVLWGRSDPEVMSVYDDLVTRYSEPWRFYHTIEHVADCLIELKTASGLAVHPCDVELALWFHDVVYDPRRGDNVERSAEYAADALEGLLDEESLSRVGDLILATRHDGVVSGVDMGLVVDVDLAILGKPQDVFQGYEEAIKKEYSWVPWGDFCAGRTRILRGFLEREHIYNTDEFRMRYEEQARHNLNYAIERLMKT
jgi:predicted metal-dependent HD superfamily phosphohydrolase